MRAFRELRPPGVYPAFEEPRTRSLDVANTRVAGFVGLAQKGPLDKPVPVRSMGEFRHTFGALPQGYLEHAVEGFFTNGGDTCFIVRVAHRARGATVVGPEHAQSAAWSVLDGWGKPTLRVEALNEGRWGNSVWARVERHVAASTLLTLDLEVGSGEARVNSARGFERGALVRIRSQVVAPQPGQPMHTEDYVILHEVDDRIIRWSAETPVNHVYKAAGPTFVEVIEFDLFCSLRDRRESFRSLQLSPLSRNYAPRAVNGTSQLVVLKDLQSRSPLPHCLPGDSPAVRLDGGRDGVDDITVEDFIGVDEGPEGRTGLQALGAVEQVAILAVPDAMLGFRQAGLAASTGAQRIQDEMLSLCERQQDRFAILDGPPTRDLSEVRKWRARVSTSYGALYYPWLITDHNGTPMLVPPSGHVAGVYARVEQEVGVHKAPGNELVKGVTAVAIELREDDLGQLNAEAINALRLSPGRGVRLWSARTLSDDPNWRYVNVRRLFIMLRRAIESGTQWAVFESNSPRTWETLSRDVSGFLEDLWARGAFAGQTPGDSYYVVCDSTTNTPERVDTGHLIMEIGVAPTLPAEFLILHLVQKSGTEERVSA